MRGRGPIVSRAVAVLRARLPAVVAVTTLLGLAGALVLTSLTAYRRGSTALDRFLEYHAAPTIEAFNAAPSDLRTQEALMRELRNAPGIAAAVIGASTIIVLPGADGSDETGVPLVGEIIVEGNWMVDVARPIVVDGELPLERGTVAVSESIARSQGVGVGDQMGIYTYPAEALETLGNGEVPPDGALEQFRVAAVIRRPADLTLSPEAQEGTIYKEGQATVAFHPSFWADHDADLATYGIGLLATPEPGKARQVLDTLRDLGGGDVFAEESEGFLLQALGPVESAMDLEARAVLVAGAIVALLALVLLGGAAARVTADPPDEQLVLTAIGLTRRDLFAARAIRAAVIATGAAIIAASAAIPLTTFTPIGLARDAELDPGIHVDGAVLAIGAVAIAIAVFARTSSSFASARGARQPRPSRTAGTAAGAGIAPAPVLGTQLGVDAATGRGRVAPPFAIVAAVVGVVAVVGATTYARTIDRLSDSPELQGWTWDAVVGNYSLPETAEAATARLSTSPDVFGFGGYNWGSGVLDGEQATLAGFDPDALALLPEPLEGRFPAAADEIALGRGTLDDLGKEIGDVVAADAGAGETQLRIVGVVVAPAVIAYEMDLDSGGVMTLDGLAEASGVAPDERTPVHHLVKFREGIDREAALGRLREDFPRTVLEPMTPLDVRDLQRVRGLPYLLAASLGVMAAASVLITLATVARRRRRELAVLRAIGFDRRGIGVLLATASVVFITLAIVVGVPLGVAVGRTAWDLAADGIGTEVGASVPVLPIAISIVALLLLLAVFGRLVGAVLARRSAVLDLRTE